MRKYYKYDKEHPIYGIDIVGSVTNTNGIVSGFTNSNYLCIPQVIPFSSNTWEIGIKLNATSIQTEFFLASTSSRTLNIYIESNRLSLDAGNGSGYFINTNRGQTTLTANTDYWIKLIFNGTNYSAYLSTNGIDYVNEISVDTTNKIPDTTLTMGYYTGNNYPFQGSIDLKECYIKIDNNYQWNGVNYPIIPGTSTDYDFFKDENCYFCGKEVTRTYYNVLLEKDTPGTYEITLPADDYLIELVGAGGGAAKARATTDRWYMASACGGSGAYFKGIVHLESNTYTINVGQGGTTSVSGWNGTATATDGGDSSIVGIITAGGGTGAIYNLYSSPRNAGYGGLITYNKPNAIIDVEKALIGLDGTTAGSGATNDSSGFPNLPRTLSVYDDTVDGVGAGAGTNKGDQINENTKALNGYCKIYKPASQSDYTHYIDKTFYKIPTKTIRKYYKYGEPQYNININGTLTNNNGTISGFSSGNYFYPTNFYFFQPFEIYLDITTGSISEQTIIAFNRSYYNSLRILNDGKFYYLNGDGAAQTASITVAQANQNYKLKFSVNSNRMCLYTWQNESWYQEWDVSMGTLTDLDFGLQVKSNSRAFLGSFNLANCYMTNDGFITWVGMQNTKVESTELDYDFYEDIPTYKTVRM